MAFEFPKNGMLILDGAMGTVLQQRGLRPGGIPELLNLTAPELLRGVYREYVRAGSQVVYTNTFGANGLKLAGTGHSVRETVTAAVRIAREAVGTAARVALDIGPLGQLLEPMGTLSFERAYELFAEIAEAGAQAGADLAVIETMTDLYEAKAALLAVKENTALPVFVTMSFEESGRSFTGCSAVSMARTLEGLGADAVGLNCSIGPDKAVPIIRQIAENTRLPVIAKPNAGLPDPTDGHYDMSPEAFAAAIAECVDAGASIVGGCCGSSPAYIEAVCRALEGKAAPEREYIRQSFVCSAVTPLPITGVRIIGERLNPTGKKRFQQALLEDDLDYILEVALQQEEAGAQILDVNVGHPGVDEAVMLPRVVKKLQSAVSVPLQFDSTDPAALEAALRVYNGKGAVNSVNGDEETLARILPIVKKYGAAVIGLTLDKNGLPKTAQERVDIAQRILRRALDFGIAPEDVWIDCLTLTVSAQQEQAVQTLRAVRTVRERLGLQTVLGVSNISFGLPSRTLITQNFLIQALACGLTLPIINPNQQEMTQAVAAFRVLSGEDTDCRAFTERFAGTPAQSSAPAGAELSLEEAIMRGLGTEAARLARQALESEDAFALTQTRLIPALDRVGADYEAGRSFLPQLLGAAQAAQAVFEVLRAHAARTGGVPLKKGRMLIATVQGDIHDIGKNIVRTVLENYGYEVLDLGRDVAPEAVADAVRRENIRLVGLSALMTTTLPAMEKTVRLLSAMPEKPLTVVGGAVVTEQYAAQIGASYYAADARQAVEIAREVFGE